MMNYSRLIVTGGARGDHIAVKKASGRWEIQEATIVANHDYRSLLGHEKDRF